jgi:serine O-acetyltransferase
MSTSNNLSSLAHEFRSALQTRLEGDPTGDYRLPSRDEVAGICRHYLDAIFPLYFSPANVEHAETAGFVAELETRFAEQLICAIRFDFSCRGKEPSRDIGRAAADLLEAIRALLPKLAFLLSTDLAAALKNDPAATGLEEILLSYPGVEAITTQRLAHELYKLKVPYLPRIMTEIAHSHTGIDIHPGARIDEGFFIDHGTGVVIGETATIGKNVTLYHGVTLGAFNPLSRRDTGGELLRGASNKRHPDLEDNVTVYPGATILGGDTLVGHHSIIGGNVWLTHSVAPYSRVTVKDPELLIRSHTKATDEEWFLGSSI